jgi:hypothetical protein
MASVRCRNRLGPVFRPTGRLQTPPTQALSRPHYGYGGCFVRCPLLADQDGSEHVSSPGGALGTARASLRVSHEDDR